MKRLRAVVVLLWLMATLFVTPLSAHAQTSDDPATSPAASRGYAYPIGWVLPLVLVIGAGAIGRALTRDLRDKR